MGAPHPVPDWLVGWLVFEHFFKTNSFTLFSFCKSNVLKEKRKCTRSKPKTEEGRQKAAPWEPGCTEARTWAGVEAVVLLPPGTSSVSPAPLTPVCIGDAAVHSGGASRGRQGQAVPEALLRAGLASTSALGRGALGSGPLWKCDAVCASAGSDVMALLSTAPEGTVQGGLWFYGQGTLSLSALPGAAPRDGSCCGVLPELPSCPFACLPASMAIPGR